MGLAADVTAANAEGESSFATIPSPFAITEPATVTTSSARLSGAVYVEARVSSSPGS